MPKPRLSRKRIHPASKSKPLQGAPPSRLAQPGVSVADPQFGESNYSPDPTQFLQAVTDNQFYKLVDMETVNQLILEHPTAA